MVLMAVEKRPSSELFERAMATCDRYLRKEPDQARVLSLACHPYLHGVPHRIGYFEKCLDELAARAGRDVYDWRKNFGLVQSGARGVIACRTGFSLSV